MIAYDEALKLIEQHRFLYDEEWRAPLDALGLRLAADIKAPIDLPPFTTSAVDGFAINSKDFSSVLVVRHEAKAGDNHQQIIGNKEAVRIMTGALLPTGCDLVIMKEEVICRDNHINIASEARHRDNIRHQGEDIKAGELLAWAGDMVTPQLIGAAHALGIDKVLIKKPASMSIISTGDELVDAGQVIKQGQVYYLMGPMLTAQAYAIGIRDVLATKVPDKKDALIKAIKQGLVKDVMVITGGMSKGEYDLVRPCLKELGVEEIFFEGAWRPGKPLFFGRLGNKKIFGLPGNPVAAFMCFQVFIRPFLGMPACLRRGVMKEGMSKKPGFTFFMRGLVDDKNEISLVPGQGSHQIVALSKANCLVVAEASRASINAHDEVWYYAL